MNQILSTQQEQMLKEQQQNYKQPSNKVRIVGLNAAQARQVIDALRANEGMAPGLLKDGRWINADSI